MNLFINLNNMLTRIRRPAPPAPARPVAVIGDVHGRADLLEPLLDRIARDHPAFLPVFTGDLIDRGPDSQAVLRRVRALGAGAVVLRGNHEQMMLDFLDDPERSGPAWLRHGGVETLASFGIAAQDPDAPAALRAALADTEGWLRALPLWWLSGTVAVVHAGADPRLPLPAQDPRALLWGHPAFGRFPRRDGIWVAHGHVIVDAPRCARGVISVDTGAWRTGRLGCALISGDGVQFLVQGS